MLHRETILKLVGRSRLDDHAIAEIARTGANEAELVEALNWVQRGDEVGAEKMKPMSPNVAAVCEILMTASGPFDDTEGVL
ncbi:MAG: hypothetical protein IPM60_12610 [Rhodospirillales bacterium]|nr:hypothetical protein [Rhodospirillales bacterium]